VAWNGHARNAGESNPTNFEVCNDAVSARVLGVAPKEKGYG